MKIIAILLLTVSAFAQIDSKPLPPPAGYMKCFQRSKKMYCENSSGEVFEAPKAGTGGQLLVVGSDIPSSYTVAKFADAHYRVLNKDPRVLGNDLKVTPGAIRTTSASSICGTKTSKLRHVTEATKRQVFAEYGIDLKNRGQFECDHNISLEIGGSNDTSNLWPQPYAYPGAHQKDVLENKLHKMICSKEITPEQAQKLITTDWYKAYKKYVKPVDGRLGR